MIYVPPFRGELGILIRFHSAAVRALPRPVTVAHESGLEALYPDVSRIVVEPRPDEERRWTYRHDKEFVDHWRGHFEGLEVAEPDKEHRLPIRPFRPEPYREQRGGADPGVVLCPRLRKYGREKNWGYWPDLAMALGWDGIRRFAAGLSESSYRIEAEEYAWDYDRPLDATIEAMRSARLVIATASGLSLLAVICGAPLLLVAAKNRRVAPGPARDLTGKVHHDSYWKVPLGDYYEPLNHSGSRIDVFEHGWEHPDLVREAVRKAMAVAV